MKQYLIFLLLFIFINADAQRIDFDNYKNIEHSGKLPADLTTTTASKYEKDRNSISKDEKSKVRKAQNQFFVESNYVLDRLIASGKVFFNDPITEYVNDVADELLKDDPALRKKLKIYSVKNASANAFTTNDGKILVNWGLLNILENEAQLAGVIAHEIIHYRDKHVLESFSEQVRIEKGIGDYRRFSRLDRVTATTNYNQDTETEADVEGLEIYLESDYNKEAFVEIFDRLALSHVPFENEAFPLSFFQVGDTAFQVNDDFMYSEIIPIESKKEEDSDSHPALEERQDEILDLLEDEGKGGNQFIVSEERFKVIQEMSRFELSKMYLYNKNYPLAIYHNFLMLKKHPNNTYLKKNLIKGVYGIAKYKNYDEYDELMSDDESDDLAFDVDDNNEIEGYSKMVYDFFYKIDGKTTTALALALCNQFLKEVDEADIEINRIFEDLVKELVVEYDFKRSTFKRTKTIKGKKSKKDDNDDNEEVRSDLSYNLAFVAKEHTKLIKGFLADKNKLERYREEVTDEEYFEYRKTLKKEGYSLGIKNLVIVDPSYLKADVRKKNPIKHLQSEAAEANFNDKISKSASSIGMKSTILSDAGIRANNNEEFADLSFLRYWFYEKLSNGNVDMVSIDYEKAQELVKKYNTKHFMWTGATSIKSPSQYGFLEICISIYLLPLAPFILGPDNSTMFYNFTFDLEDDELVIYDYNLIESKDSRAVVSSNIYYQLWQISRK